MRINQNISAMNTYSRLTAANNAKTNSLAKLSSGLRINKAGDDAAGLAISEKMRGQVGGLKQAIRNAQDGISLIQTAEGALNETHSILNRMRELAVQAANGTNTNDDRVEIQKEINQLVEEISRIADTTQFNNQNLLDGEFATRFHIGANKGQGMDLKIEGMDAVALGLAENAPGEGATAAVITIDDTSGILTTDFTSNNLGIIVNGTEVELESVNVLEGSSENPIDSDDLVNALATDINDELGDDTVTVTFEDGVLTIETVDTGSGVSLEFIGDGATALGIAGEATGEDETDGLTNIIDVSNRDAADAAIATIDKAVAKVSTERSNLGSVQNRLEHTINNLTATAENLSAAESRIRDVDMAEEMMEFTKNNILSQAATAMLAQANQMPNSVLQLLQ